MMNKAGRPCRALRGTLAGACLCAFAVPALAQDSGQPTTDRDNAVNTLGTWGSFGAADEQETLEETFFRLSRDFATTTEGGIRRLGSVPIWPRGDIKVLGIRILPYLRE